MSKKKKPITIEDLWAMKRFGAASLSPDGHWACVAVSSYSMTGNDSLEEKGERENAAGKDRQKKNDAV